MRFVREGAEALKAEKPSTVAFLAYVSDDGTAASFVHLFPDEDAMDLHFEGATQRSAASREFIEGGRFEVYGTPSRPALEALRDGQLRVEPTYAGGFTRLMPA